jgi:hypothetical protein
MTRSVLGRIASATIDSSRVVRMVTLLRLAMPSAFASCPRCQSRQAASVAISSSA